MPVLTQVPEQVLEQAPVSYQVLVLPAFPAQAPRVTVQPAPVLMQGLLQAQVLVSPLVPAVSAKPERLV